MKLSIVIPAYNEEKTIVELISKVLKVKSDLNFEKEIIIVNDCSKDRTLELVNTLAASNPNITVINNKTNVGKSQSVKLGILESTGDWVVIQDADLEYDPNDFVFMLEQAIRLECDVAYGNRFGIDNGVGYIKNFVGNIGLSFFSNIFTLSRIRVYIPDMEVCYKLARGDIYRQVAATIKSKSNFGFEPEITAKLSRYISLDNKCLKFVTLPIHYFPRTLEQGKKMHAIKDGAKALVEIIRFNLFS